MKYVNKLSVRIVLSLFVGILFAGALTKITYPCADFSPEEYNAKGCVSIEKAIVHPSDLISNKQNSLVRFSVKLSIVSAITIVSLSALARLKKQS